MIEELKQQQCIPVVTTMKKLERFLETELRWCVLQDIHIALLEDMIVKLHRNEKFALVHIEMINGITNDEFGTEFLCQKIRVDGIISSKSKIIEITKRNRKCAIQRMFLIDSKSIERGVEMLMKSQPDAVEVMPAIALKVIPDVKKRLMLPLIGGGLIRDLDDIKDGLSAGFMAFTVSNLELCLENKKRRLGK